MTHQAALVHNPDKAGLWRRVLLTDGAVNAAPWHDAIAQQQLVGTCKPCGGYLKPGLPYRVGLIDWFPAHCIGRGDNAGCGGEMAAAGPRPKQKPAQKGRSY